MRNQRYYSDSDDWKVFVQPGTEEYRIHLWSLERRANETKRINRYIQDEKIEKIARYFALKKHVPSSQEALDYIAVFKTPYRLYKPLCNIANVASCIGFLLFLFVALFIPEGWLNAFSVVYSLFLYFVATSFLFQYFMSLRFNSASFAAVALTKHYLGIIDLNSKK